MRILFVTPYVPSLVRVRPLNFIRHLSKRHEVTLVSLAQGDPGEAEALEELRRYCEDVHVFSLSKPQCLASCCRRLLTRLPLQAAYTHLAGGRELVSQVAGSRRFDVLHVEHIRGAHLTEGVTNIPKVYDSVDCITRLLKQRLVKESGLFQRVIGYEELLKMRSYEPRIASAFDSVVITSEHDKRALECLMRRFVRQGNGGPPRESDRRRMARTAIELSQDLRLNGLSRDGAEIAVVPNGVDSEYFRPMADKVSPATIVFSGKMGYFPNISAVLRFYREIFPLVKRARSDARFKIVGSDPPDAVRNLARDPAVEVTGYVPDLRPHLASASVVACPLTVGVGIQNKVLEAMAMGKPVVVTSVAISGLPDAVSGLHLAQANDPAEMASAIVELLDKPARGQELGENARRLIEKRYSWEVSGKKLEAVHEEAAYAYRNRLPIAA